MDRARRWVSGGKSAQRDASELETALAALDGAFAIFRRPKIGAWMAVVGEVDAEE